MHVIRHDHECVKVNKRIMMHQIVPCIGDKFSNLVWHHLTIVYITKDAIPMVGYHSNEVCPRL